MEPVDVTTTHLFFFSITKLTDSVCAVAAKAAFDVHLGDIPDTIQALRCGRRKLQELRDSTLVPPMEGTSLWPSTRSQGKAVQTIIKESELLILEATTRLHPTWSNYQIARFLGIKEYKVRRIKESQQKQ